MSKIGINVNSTYRNADVSKILKSISTCSRNTASTQRVRSDGNEKLIDRNAPTVPFVALPTCPLVVPSGSSGEDARYYSTILDRPTSTRGVRLVAHASAPVVQYAQVQQSKHQRHDHGAPKTPRGKVVNFKPCLLSSLHKRFRRLRVRRRFHPLLSMLISGNPMSQVTYVSGIPWNCMLLPGTSIHKYDCKVVSIVKRGGVTPRFILSGEVIA